MKRILAAAAAALLLAGCGSTGHASTDSASSGKGITLTDGTGTKVHLDHPATRVVGTEWVAVEDLVELGVSPVGVADVKGYRTWDTAVPLTGKPKDIGTRGEPSTDTIASLDPDLIVATTDLKKSVIKQLRRIAPVLVLRPAKASDQLGMMKKDLDLIAKATGKSATASQLMDAFHAKLASGRKKLEQAGLAGAKVAVGDGYAVSNQVTIRSYTKGSIIGAVNTELGLENAWTGDGDAVYGLGSTDVEGLTKLGDVRFAYIASDSDGGDVFRKDLADNAVWKSLPFVEKGHVHRLENGIWMFGGPGSMESYVDSIVATLTAK